MESLEKTGVWHMEVSDDYLARFEAAGFDAACEHARKTAREHGGLGVWLYPGEPRSGVYSVARFGPSGRRLA